MLKIRRMNRSDIEGMRMKYGSMNVVEVKVKLIVDESTVWIA
jgi:hypothetical protein